MSDILAFDYEYEHSNAFVNGEIEVIVVVSDLEVRAFELIDFKSELDMLKTFFGYVEAYGKKTVVTHYLGNFMGVVKERVSLLDLLGVDDSAFAVDDKAVNQKGIPIARPLSKVGYNNSLGLPYRLTDLVTNMPDDVVSEDLVLAKMSKATLRMPLVGSKDIIGKCAHDAVTIYNIANKIDI